MGPPDSCGGRGLLRHVLRARLEDQAASDDNVFDAQGIKVYIDKHSAPYLSGIEIDFVDNNMMGAGFAIKNPNVKSSCGCGQSHRF